MGLKLTLCFSLFFLILSYLFYKQSFGKTLAPPKLDVNEYWGPGSKTNYKEDKSVRSYKINYNDKVINNLKSQLGREFIYHEPLENVAFEYGFNSKRLKEIVTYWRDEYLPKWTERQNYFNQFKHFKTQIQGLDIHFINEKPIQSNIKNKKVLPMLLLHGWPGSVREFYEIIPKLTAGKNSEYVFEVVAPSLPGYGWSQASSKTGLGAIQIAVVLRNLMLRLGHEKFLIQGGDWGSVIGGNLAILFPENVLGFHSNMCTVQTGLAFMKHLVASLYPKLFLEKEDLHFMKPISVHYSQLLEESGYFHLQATKPDTIGIVLTDNPIGLTAYIMEKFSTGTNETFKRLPDGGLEKHFTLDALLDNVMTYYLTNSAHTAGRLYAETMTESQRAMQISYIPVMVPTACAIFKNDIGNFLKWQLLDKYPKLSQLTYYSQGGHFAAFQSPEVLYQDFISFVTKIIQ